MKVQLLYDAGPGIGLGHCRRMSVLAAALRRQGAEVDLTVLGNPGSAAADVVVVDAYTMDANRSEFASGAVAAIDDLGRRLDVDLIVRPAPTPGPASGDIAQVLSGFDYALVDPGCGPAGPAEPYDALVSFGATDVAGLGAAVAEAVADRRPGICVAHAPGPWSVRADPDHVVVLEAPAGLMCHLRRARVVICSGGVTMVESMVAGRPTIVRPTAGNQMPAASAVAAAGAALVLAAEEGVPAIVEAAVSLMGDPSRQLEFSSSAGTLIDGRGPDRVAEAIVGLV